MAIFDAYIEQTDRYVEEMRTRGRLVRELSRTSSPADISATLPFRIGSGASPGIVMKSDTFLELGSPAAGSCAFALSSDHPALIRDGRVRLIGPDVTEAPLATLSFGQVIMAAGETVADEDYQALVQSQYIGDQVEGYMVKSAPGHIWTRVSRDVAQKGFCFELLGMALITLVKARLPNVTAAEVLFVTSGKADVQSLGEIGARVNDLGREIRARLWQGRGIDLAGCAFGGHCGTCEDKSVCQEINNITLSRRSMSQTAGSMV
jgi:CO dehydrogenase/acetyl-CoA synthase beta subunit